MSTALRLVRLLAPFRGWIALSTLLGFATVGAGIGLMATAAFLIASAALHPSVADLALAIVGVRFFGLSRGVLRYLERYASHSTTFRLLAGLRVWFYEALEPLAPARLLQHRSGDLLGRAIADIETLQHFYVRVAAPSLVALLVAVATWLLLASFDSSLAWTLLTFLLLAGVALPVTVERLSRGLGRQSTRLRAELGVEIVDGLQGMADLVAFGRERDQLDRVLSLNRRRAHLQERMGQITALHSAAGTLLANLGMAAMLLIAIPLVTGGVIEGVYLPVLALVALTSFEAVFPLPLAFQHLSSCLEAARRLFEIADSDAGAHEFHWGKPNPPTPFPRREGGAQEFPLPEGEAANNFPLPEGEGQGEGERGSQPNIPSPRDASWRGVTPLPVAAGEGDEGSPSPRGGGGRGVGSVPLLSVQNLGFRYAPDQPRVLDWISFKLEAGQRAAIVGPSGAGKSTLLHLLLRFWDYEEGQILLAGRELRDYPDETARRHMATVSQRTHLFSGTLRHNMLLACPEATEDQLSWAIQQARLHAFVQQLPEGLDSWIGEQGLQLSGGERQRLAVARALLKDAPILLLDEPTANLDSITEREVMRSLHSLMEDRTTLLVTHRLVGLESMDQILVLRAGRLVEQGTHRELLDRPSLYRRMWESQRQLLSS